MQGAETEMQLAFDKGFGFYESKLYYANFKLLEKTYYFKLFAKYASNTNNNFINNFIPRWVNKDQQATMIAQVHAYDRMSDSICVVTVKQQSGAVKEIMKNQCAMETAKRKGNIEEYLSLLNKIKEMTTSDALDKIECLIIFGKGKEAQDFAKKIVVSLKKSSNNTFDLFADGRAIQNFASESFAW
jgi:hypothetical protein